MASFGDVDWVVCGIFEGVLGGFTVYEGLLGELSRPDPTRGGRWTVAGLRMAGQAALKTQTAYHVEVEL